MKKSANASAVSSEVYRYCEENDRQGSAGDLGPALDTPVAILSPSDPTYRQRIDSKERTDGKIMPPETEKNDGMGASLLSHRSLEDYDDDATAVGNKSRTTQLRNDAAFWVLGLLNNSPYVIMMAFAKEIAPGAVGVVFVADVAPTFIIKMTAPCW